MVQDLEYQWDPVGNLAKIGDTSQGINQWQCFTYDSLDRYRWGYTWADNTCGAGNWVVGPDPYWTDFQYDSIGNITQAVGTGTVAGTYTIIRPRNTLSPPPVPTPTATTRQGT